MVSKGLSWLIHKVSTVPLSHHATGEQDIKKVQGLALGFPGGANGIKPACQCRRHKGCEFRSSEGGHGNPLRSCLENPMDRGIWWATYSPWGCKVLDMTEATEHA